MISWYILYEHPEVQEVSLIQELIYSITEETAHETIIKIFLKYQNNYLDYVLNSLNQSMTDNKLELYIPIIEKLISIHGKKAILIWSHLKKNEVSPQIEQYIRRGRGNLCHVSDSYGILRIIENDDINEICNFDSNQDFNLNCLHHLNKSIIGLLNSYQNNTSLSLIELICLFGKPHCFKYCENLGEVNENTQEKLFHYSVIGKNYEIISTLAEKYKIKPKLIDMKIAIMQADSTLFGYFYDINKEYLCQDEINKIIKWCLSFEYLNGLETINIYEANYLLDVSIDICYGFITNILLKNIGLTEDMKMKIIQNSTKNLCSINSIMNEHIEIKIEIKSLIKKPDFVPSIPNLGNTCYMATNVQLLINSDAFAKLIQNIVSHYSIDEFIIIIIEIYLNFYFKRSRSIDLSPFFYIFDGYHIGVEEDTHEFYADFFSYLSHHYHNEPNNLFYCRKSERNGYERYMVAYPIESNAVQRTTVDVIESHDIFCICVQRMGGVQNYIPMNIPYTLSVANNHYSIYSITETYHHHCVVYFVKEKKYYYASDSHVREISNADFNQILHNNRKSSIILYHKSNEVTPQNEEVLAQNVNEFPDVSYEIIHKELPDGIQEVNLYLWQLNFTLSVNVNPSTTTFQNISNFLVTHLFDNDKICERLIDYDLIYKDNFKQTMKISQGDKLSNFKEEISENTILVYFKNVKVESELYHIMSTHCKCCIRFTNCSKCGEKIKLELIIEHEKDCVQSQEFTQTTPQISIENCIADEKVKDHNSENVINKGIPPSSVHESPLFEELMNMNLIKLNGLLNDPELTYQFLRKINHIKDCKLCQKCGYKMKIERDSSQYLNRRYRCYRCNASSSLLTGTIYARTKLTPKEFILVIYMFSCYYGRKKTAFETGVSESTVTNIFTTMRNACEKFLMDGDIEPVGGPGHVLEIDETLVSRRKYNKGRVVKENWLFGGIDRVTNEIFAFLVDDRRANTLLEVIEECILPGTTIISDEWASYKRLHTDKKFSNKCQHRTINHSMHFVDPSDKSINTQKIERLWRSIKRFKEQGVPGDKLKLQAKLCEMVLRQKHQLDEHNSFAWFMLYLIPEIDFK